MSDGNDMSMDTSVRPVHGLPMVEDIEDDFEPGPMSSAVDGLAALRTDVQLMLPPNPDRFRHDRYLRRMFFYVIGDDFTNETGNNRAEAFFRSLTRRDRTALELFGGLIYSRAEFVNPYHRQPPKAALPSSAMSVSASASSAVSVPVSASWVASASVSVLSMESESEAEALGATRAAESALASTLSAASDLLSAPSPASAPVNSPPPHNRRPPEGVACHGRWP
jgi:hypothetical protein